MIWCYVAERGDLYTAGSNEFGQLGHPDVFTELPEFKQVEGLRGRVVRSLACGGGTT